MEQFIESQTVDVLKEASTEMLNEGISEEYQNNVIATEAVKAVVKKTIILLDYLFKLI